MVTLTPYGKSSLTGDVMADLCFEKGGAIVLTYRWDPEWKSLGGMPGIEPWGAQRRHELWKSTCFEAFIKAQGQDSYWEINLSPPHQWNAYVFDRYREPSPPREAPGWKLLEMSADAGSLRARLQTDLPSRQAFQVGLSCIIETTSGEKVYWSLRGGNKPDFHDDRCFLLERSSL